MRSKTWKDLPKATPAQNRNQVMVTLHWNSRHEVQTLESQPTFQKK